MTPDWYWKMEPRSYARFLVCLNLAVFVIALPIALHTADTIHAIVYALWAVAIANLALALFHLTRIGR